MKAKNSLVTSIGGGLGSALPVLLSCCKSGACIGVCASPLASLFGISAATMTASPIMGVLEPLLIAGSAVAFTVSYYSLYVLPKQNCAPQSACDCNDQTSSAKKMSLNKFVFWFGLLLSLGFLSYFEYGKYQQSRASELQAASCESGSDCSVNSACSDSESCDPENCTEEK